MTDLSNRENSGQGMQADVTSPHSSLHQQQQAEGAPAMQMPPPPPIKKTIWDLAKTALDPYACKEVLSQIMTRQETQLSGQKTAEPKHFAPIENYKMASPCAAAWEQMTGTTRVRFCSLCQQQVYDFSNTDKAEADDLIFQREGKKAEVLFKRSDGRFLTADCLVGAAKKRNTIIAVMAGLLVLFGLIALALNAMQQQPSATTGLTTESSAPPVVHASKSSGKVTAPNASDAPIVKAPASSGAADTKAVSNAPIVKGPAESNPKSQPGQAGFALPEPTSPYSSQPPGQQPSPSNAMPQIKRNNPW